MKIVKTLASIAKHLVMMSLIIIMLLIVADVFLRAVFNAPILGTVDIAQMLMAVCLLATASTAQENRHIKIDILYLKFSPKVRALFDMITLTLSFIAAMLIASRAFMIGVTAVQANHRFDTIDFPRAPFIFLFSFGLLIIGLSVIGFFIDAVRRFKNEQ